MQAPRSYTAGLPFARAVGYNRAVAGPRGERHCPTARAGSSSCSGSPTASGAPGARRPLSWAGGGCGGCKEQIQGLIDEFLDEEAAAKEKKPMTNLQRIKLIKLAVSLGGLHSLMTHPASTISAVRSTDEIAASGVQPGLVRFSVGLEDTEDIVADLEQALPPGKRLFS